MRHATILAALLLPASVMAAAPPLQFSFERGGNVAPTDLYDAVRGFGFEPSASGATSTRFSVKVPEGNYRVTMRLGAATGVTRTTVKGESRRLLLESVVTPGRKFVTRTVIVNVRTPALAAPALNAPGGSAVRLKPRELESAAWDDKLTLEFLGSAASVTSLSIEPTEVPTVYLAGDSTVTDQASGPGASWGQMLPRFFAPDVAIANHAEGGETLKSFLAELRLDKILATLKAGDWLLIQFGHNDQKAQWPQTYVEAGTTYRAYLRTYIAEARRRGATPILITSPERRNFGADGRIVDSHRDYPDAVRTVAREESVALIDLHAMSKRFYEALGPLRAPMAFDDGGRDLTHHSDYGAYELARMIVAGLRAADPQLTANLARHLTADAGQFDPTHPDEPDRFSLTDAPTRLSRTGAPGPAPPTGSTVTTSREALRAELTIRADAPGNRIDPAIYGQFAEHLGRGIYDGIWVGERSAIPNTRGFRNDVIAALKDLRVPVLRWPGGCFADEYHWRDGIGPRDQRPRRVNTNWGDVVEDNAVGTHEFMDFAELIGAEVYINGNIGTGTPNEMADWVEYLTSDTDSTLARLRRSNGRAKPWKVAWFAVGNETWGCGGNMRPEYYADLYRRYSTFIKAPRGSGLRKIASGGNASNTNWTEVMMREAAKRMDALSVHYYTLPSGKWEHKGSSTQFDETEWIVTLARTLRMDSIITNHAQIMDRYDPEKRVGLFVDEWGTWYDVEPGTEPGFLYQQNSLRDALVAAVNLNIFHAHADRVRMTNIAQMVNVLQAMILTDKERMVLTPTYHVFHLYKAFQGATQLPVELESPPYRLGETVVPAVHASAARDSAGKLQVSLANLDPTRPASLSIRIAGARIGKMSGRILSAPRMNTINTFEHPDAVRPAAFRDVRVESDRLVLTLPAKSVVVLAGE